MRHLTALLIVCACLGAGHAPAQTTEAEPDEDRRDSGLVEETRRRLIQLDVSVTGPPERTAHLTADDFELDVGGTLIEGFHADRVCGGQPRPATLSTPRELEAAEGREPPVVGVSYLLYFDQNHLTMEGRRHSLEVARELIPRLIHEPNRASVISSGRKLEILADWTSDQQVLLDALDVLEQDPMMWDEWASQEDARILSIFGVLELEMDSEGGMASLDSQQRAALLRAAPGLASASAFQAAEASGHFRNVSPQETTGGASAKNVARMYRKEEKWHTERSLTRFSMALARMEAMHPPKAVVYFADRMRSNAGDHYLYLFRRNDFARADPKLSLSNSRVIAFEEVLNEAAANGVRLYTVQAEGIPAFLPTPVRGQMMKQAVNISPEATTRRFDEARESLAALALESGGRAFLNGASSDSIVERLQEDLDCFYILSFDPKGFREDSVLPVIVNSKRKGVKMSTRGRLVVRSESARLQSRLTAAFVDPDRERDGSPLNVTVIPLSFHKGAYSALVQIAVPGSNRPGATWDVGLSLLSGERVRVKESQRLEMATPGVPLILERRLEFGPGPYELVVVAHEDGSEKISSGQMVGDWPDPKSPGATIGPIALLQPGAGAFVQGDDVRREGPLAKGDMARTDRPTALVGIVCRPDADALSVERTLVGASSAVFPSLELEADGDRCSVFSDTIPSETMTSGRFRYEVRVLSHNEVVAAKDHEFMAAALSDFGQLEGSSR